MAAFLFILALISIKAEHSLGQFVSEFPSADDMMMFQESEDGERRSLADGGEFDIPTHFDAREQWPKCIHPIRNNFTAACLSGWANAQADALSDRFCIASGGTINVTLSSRHLLSCYPGDNNCYSNSPNVATFLLSPGLVTEKCWPYSNYGQECRSTCVKSSEKWKTYKGKSWRKVLLMDKAQAEIIARGPIVAMFWIDSFTFLISQPKIVAPAETGSNLKLHAVKIVGWGEESDGTRYWIAANSYINTLWGDNGYFRLQRGPPLVMVAVDPDLNS